MTKLTPARAALRRNTVGAIVALGLAASAVGCAPAAGGGGGSEPPAALAPVEADGDLTWLSWEGYVDPDVISEFEAEYGIKVNFEYFDSDEQAIQKLATGQAYDLFTGNSGYMERTLSANLLRPINIDEIDTSDLLPYFENPWYDDGEERYTVPYGYGPTGFFYNTKVVTNNTDSWEAFWTNPEARISVQPLPEETIGFSLMNLGYEITSSDEAEIVEATDRLLEFRDQVVEMTTSNDVVLNGQVDLYHTFSGEAFNILKEIENPEDWAFTLPEGQAPIGGNVVALGANAEHPGSAQLLMDWLLRPENASRNTLWNGYYFGTHASLEAMNELTSDYPFLQVDVDFLDTAPWKNSATGERLDIMTEQWNRFKAS